jgi:hypothetical protein
MGNPMQVHQMIMNLCANIAQAMEDKGGLLEIRQLEIMIDRRILCVEEFNYGYPAKVQPSS